MKDYEVTAEVSAMAHYFSGHMDALMHNQGIHALQAASEACTFTLNMWESRDRLTPEVKSHFLEFYQKVVKKFSITEKF